MQGKAGMRGRALPIISISMLPWFTHWTMATVGMVPPPLP